MNKKIGIYETRGHYTFLVQFLQILHSLQYEIFLFTSQKIYEELKLNHKDLIEDMHIKVTKSKFTKLFFNIYVSYLSRKYDLFIANTLQGGRISLLSYLFLIPKCEYILIDSLYGDVYLKEFNKFRWDRYTNYIAYKISQKQITRADKLIYHSREIIKKIRESLPSKSFLYLPFAFYDENMNMGVSLSDKKKTTFTVTGGIENFRKDYDLIFESLELAIEKNSNIAKQIKIIFLGTPKTKNNSYGWSIIKKAESFNKKFGEIITFYDHVYIDESEYRQRIRETDVIVNPIKLNYYKYDSFCSGLCESITYSIPGLYPYGYNIIDEMSSSSLFFNDPPELSELILKLTSDDEYLNRLAKNALENSNNLSLEHYKNELEVFLGQS